MRSGSVTITAPITLVQASGNPSQSFLIFLPIYSTAVTPETVAERERQLVGWSFAPLLMKEVLGKLSVNTETTELILSDITNTSAHEEFFHSKTHTSQQLMSQTIERDVMGRRWQIELGIYPSFIQKLNLASAKLRF